MGQMDQQYLGLVGAYDGTVMHVFLNILLYSKDFFRVQWDGSQPPKDEARKKWHKYKRLGFWYGTFERGDALLLLRVQTSCYINQLMWRIYRIIYRVF